MNKKSAIFFIAFAFICGFLIFLVWSLYKHKLIILEPMQKSQVDTTPTIIRAVEQTLDVNGHQKTVFNLIQDDGTVGFIGNKGEDFNVTLVNETQVPISIHWHGILLPNDQDGVPYVTQLPIQPGESRNYHYPLLQAGTYWMHSHYRFHEQDLMSAPMILKDPQNKDSTVKDVTVMFHDFIFENTQNVFDQLIKDGKADHTMQMNYGNGKDLNDVTYDALLANRKTLSNPEVVEVKSGQKVRLRLIDGSAASNLWVSTGTLESSVIAVDGNDVEPITGNYFQIAVAQRIDLYVNIPDGEGIYPILAQIEGSNLQAGVILKTPNASVPDMGEQAENIAVALNDKQEFTLHSKNPLQKREISRTVNFTLSGSMSPYVWKMNDQVWPSITPQMVREGDRVRMIFKNESDMAHPMHLHGHVFQVVDINGQQLKNGPLRDTILVQPHTYQAIEFDALYPGIWMTHCHVLYHMAAGMMSTTNYYDYPEPLFYRELIEGKIQE